MSLVRYLQNPNPGDDHPNFEIDMEFSPDDEYEVSAIEKLHSRFFLSKRDKFYWEYHIFLELFISMEYPWKNETSLWIMLHSLSQKDSQYNCSSRSNWTIPWDNFNFFKQFRNSIHTCPQNPIYTEENPDFPQIFEPENFSGTTHTPQEEVSILFFFIMNNI